MSPSQRYSCSWGVIGKLGAKSAQMHMLQLAPRHVGEGAWGAQNGANSQPNPVGAGSHTATKPHNHTAMEPCIWVQTHRSYLASVTKDIRERVERQTLLGNSGILLGMEPTCTST